LPTGADLYPEALSGSSGSCRPEPDERRRIRQEQAKPILDEFHDWLTRHRLQVPNGSSTAKAIDYSLKRWTALAHYIDDGQVPIDNNWIENRIRPIATGRKNWLFAGSLRAGKRAAAIMSLIQSAKLNGHDPFLYLKDILSRLPTQPNSRIGEVAAASLAARLTKTNAPPLAHAQPYSRPRWPSRWSTPSLNQTGRSLNQR
jgi:hypothetical protein